MRVALFLLLFSVMLALTAIPVVPQLMKAAYAGVALPEPAALLVMGIGGIGFFVSRLLKRR